MKLYPSQLKLWQECGVRWHKRYIERKRVELVNSAIAHGRAFDISSSTSYQLKLFKRTPRASTCEELYVDEWRSQLPLIFLKEKISNAEANKIENSGRAAVKDWAAKVMERTAPIEIQPTIEREMVDSDGVPFVLAGKLDLIAKRANTKIWIEQKALLRGVPDTNTLQTACYALLMAGTPASLDFINSQKKSADSLPIIIANPRGWIRTIQFIAAQIRKGVAQPTAKGTWRCTPRWCEYFYDCEYGGKTHN